MFGPTDRFPFATERAYTPPEAHFPTYRSVMEGLGLSRAVLVQPSVYGTDNRALLDALAQGRAEMRGVAVIGDEADQDLAALHAAGVRGVRVNRLFPSAPAVADLGELAGRIAPFGWHLQLLIDVSQAPDQVRRLADLPVPTVIDHLGHLPAALGCDHPGFQALLGLLRDGRSWVKLSAPYRLSAQAGPPYDDLRPMAEALLDAAPERALWGSDWPHPAIGGPRPDPAKLLDPLFDWIDDPALRRRVLVDNPARLYGFS
ncbi:MAG: amidohydrolase family protein [Kiloniellales bacterium]|nr:amidohydrolase family protein [Kiloniellales bacterium]